MKQGKTLIFAVFLMLYSTGLLGQYNNIYTEKSWEERDRWQNAQAILKALRIGNGSVVADIGSHEGYMSMKLASLVGESGKVYAVDLDAYKLRKLEAHAEERDLQNIETVHGKENDPLLPEETFDAILVLDTYHEIDAYEVVLVKLKQALKPGGRLVLVEPISDARKWWSRKRQAEKHEIAVRYGVKDLEKVGFEIVQRVDPFIDREKEKGDKLWILVAVKPKPEAAIEQL